MTDLASIRFGHGFDVHRLEAGHELIIGGVQIAHYRGLVGHSDADVLLHALTDALLGALGWGDIGTWFPDTDPAFKDADSLKLLDTVWSKAQAERWQLLNCDTVVMAQLPKLAPHIPAMKSRIQEVLGCDTSQIGIKATTTEKLGFVGREEGIAASAVCGLIRGN